MKTVLETITPSRAAELLKKNTRNRVLSASKVLRYSRDLAANSWPVSHQGIGLAPSFVVDGQHRLTAIKETGIACEMFVTYYDSDEQAEAALSVIDMAGVSRKIGDSLEIAGTVRRGDGKNVNAVVRAMTFLGFGTSPAGKQPTVSEVAESYRNEKAHIDWALRTLNGKRFTTVHRAAFTIAHILDEVRAEAFATQIVDMVASEGSCSQAWLKADADGRFSTTIKSTSSGMPYYNALRVLQAFFNEEPAPKQLKATVTTLSWFRNQISDKREREQKALAQLAPRGHEMLATVLGA